MKINVDGYEINIEARYAILRDEMNESDTKAFLTTIALMACDARELNEAEGYLNIAKHNRSVFRDIVDQTR